MSPLLSKETSVCYQASDRRHDHLANKIVEGVVPERFVADDHHDQPESCTNFTERVYMLKLDRE